MADDRPAIIDVTREDAAFAVFECLVRAEAERRAGERKAARGSLDDFEKTYFGPEAGAIRRAFNRVLLDHMDTGGELLDYGCGGAWWKDEYWGRFRTVHAAEVDRSALEEIAAHFPAAVLWLTRNGLIETEKRFDVVLSSSVVGYILPVQAEHHVATCHELLKEGGQLIVTRVLAHNLIAFLKGQRLVHVAGASFAYHYTKRDLVGLLKRQGFREIRAFALGARVPLLSWRANQALYRRFPTVMARLLPRLLPFLKIHHMVVARK